jgi:hypothetical protein
MFWLATPLGLVVFPLAQTSPAAPGDRGDLSTERRRDELAGAVRARGDTSNAVSVSGSRSEAFARRRSRKRDGDTVVGFSVSVAPWSIARCATAAAAAAAAVALALDRALGGGDSGDRPAPGVAG